MTDARGAEIEGEASEVVDSSVFNPLPIGARDLLPAAAKRRRRITDVLLAGFERWGYREVMPPLIEYFEVLGRGLGSDERERCVRFIEAGTGELVALRSDVTPQIARMVAQRVGGSVEPGDGLRLSYAATLVRLPSGRHDRAELHQVGVEYVGDPRPTADAELIGLADQALLELGSSTHRFDLSHTGLVREAIASLRIPTRSERALREALARKDPSGVASLLEHAGIAAEVIEAFAALAELHGPPSLLADAHERLAPLGVGAAIDHLREVVDAVAREHEGASERLLVDLGEPRGFDYYTGLRVRVWAPGASGPIARGGRYDDLLGRYGAALPATGLAFELDALEEALAHGNGDVAGSELAPARLVAIGDGSAARAGALRAAAVSEARRARAEGLRAWIDEGIDLAHAQRLAERRGAERITWFQIVGEAVTGQRWRRAAAGWQLESNAQEQA
ncbi:MAG TPA: ATP phosphoribosyltransferase regulatory subunit [Enhygromyxa sp.]|nr:ATP phosphoribosyltransferase regulatory subunit [Enhygromyxa sp.]